MTNYLYLLYGNDAGSYTEAAYSIGTLSKKMDKNSSRIIVFSDQPEAVKGWPVIHESIGGQLSEMRGKTDFSHRAKLCVILKCFEQYPGNVFYLDSDTFVSGNIIRLTAQLTSGTAMMHSYECLNPQIGLAGFQTVLGKGSITYGFSEQSHMYNAGVIALHRDNRDVIHLALELCDALLEHGSRIHTAEQFSVSEAMRLSGIEILEARRAVTHYMGHRYYMREKILEMAQRTGRPPWQFQNAISYSHLKVKWLRKFGYYLK